MPPLLPLVTTMSITSAAGDETKRIVELALHEREDEAVRRLTAIVERDKRSFDEAVADSVGGYASAEHRYADRIQKIGILMGTFGGMATPGYIGMGHIYLGWALPCLTVMVLTTIVCTAIGAGLGKWIGR
jgi:hypothetical protein